MDFLVGRGGAKTTTLRARALLKMVSIPRADILYVALTRPSAEKLNWFKVKDLIEAYGLTKDFYFQDSKLRVTCTRTGAIYTMVGAEDDRDIEVHRGQPFNEVQVDEAASHDPDRLERFIDRIVGPRLGERNGCLVLGGTPGHRLRGPFYDATRPGGTRHRPYADRDKPEYAGWKGWSSHSWTLKDVIDLPDGPARYPALYANWQEALVERAEKGWSEDNPIWMREYMGRWAADDTNSVFKYKAHAADGSAWNQWDPFGEHKLEGLPALRMARSKLPAEFKDWRFIVACDTGTADPFACNIFAFAPADPTKTLWHIFCFERTEVYSRLIAELMLGPGADHTKSAGLFGDLGWPDAMVMDADPATILELTNVYGLRFKKFERNPNYKQGAIEVVNSYLIDGKLKVIKGSHLEVQMQELQWAEDSFGKVKEDKRQANHSSDCAIMACFGIGALFDSGAVVSEAPTGYKDPMGLASDHDWDADLKRDEFSDMLTTPEWSEPSL